MDLWFSRKERAVLRPVDDACSGFRKNLCRAAKHNNRLSGPTVRKLLDRSCLGRGIRPDLPRVSSFLPQFVDVGTRELNFWKKHFLFLSESHCALSPNNQVYCCLLCWFATCISGQHRFRAPGLCIARRHCLEENHALECAQCQSSCFACLVSVAAMRPIHDVCPCRRALREHSRHRG